MVRSFFLFLSAIFLVAAAPEELPRPENYVSDFANIIDDEREAVINQNINSFEQVTTVEIAVVTIDSLNDYDIADWTNRLFRQWGIGKEGANNGVMIVVAPNERKYRIEVGYGLEWILPDGRAHQIGLLFPDYFREGDYTGGIENVTNRVIAQIGTRSREEHLEMLADIEEESQKKRDAIFGTIVNIFLFILSGGFIAFIFVRIKRALKRRKEEAEQLAVFKADVADMERDFHDLKKEVSSGSLQRSIAPIKLPNWIASKVRKTQEVATSSSRQIDEALKNVPEISRKNLHSVHEAVTAIAEPFGVFRGSVRTLRDISNEIQSYRKQTEETVESLAAKLDNLRSLATELSSEGYTYISVLNPEQLVEFTQSVNAIRNELDARGVGPEDTSDQILAQAEALQQRLQEKQSLLQEFRSESMKILAIHNDIFDTLDDADEALIQYSNTMAVLERTMPGDRLDHCRILDLGSKLPEMRIKAEELKISDAYTRATLADFKESVLKIVAYCEQVTSLARKVSDMLSKNEVAKAKFKKAHTEAARAVRDAESEVSDSDVENAARQSLQKAKKQKQLAVNAADATLVDWVFVISTLQQSVTYAEDAKSKAEDDKEEAASRRRRRAASTSYSSGSSYSSSGSSGSFGGSSGGFGGFGGGSSGGGGASGGW